MSSAWPRRGSEQEGGLFLVHSFYHVQRDQNNEHAKYDVFDWSYMKGTAKNLGDVMDPGVYRYCLCSTLQITFWYKTLSSEEKGGGGQQQGESQRKMV